MAEIFKIYKLQKLEVNHDLRKSALIFSYEIVDVFNHVPSTRQLFALLNFARLHVCYSMFPVLEQVPFSWQYFEELMNGQYTKKIVIYFARFAWTNNKN